MTGAPLCIDLFCGLGGWTEGFLAEGWEVVGFDITRHQYGDQKYPAQLVIQDVLTIHGSQFKNADCIVASPPCQQYSWLAMPWSRSKDPNNSKAAKALRKEWETNGPDNRLFDACFRIQREAVYARRLELRCCALSFDKPGCPRCHIPLIVENVRGAQPWVGRSAWNFGSFHLWGDVPALMPVNLTRRMKSRIDCAPRRFSDRIAGTREEAHALHYRLPDEGQKFNPDGTNRPGGSWFAIADSSQGDRRKGSESAQGSDAVINRPADKVRAGSAGSNPADSTISEGLKIGGDWFSDPNSTCRKHGSRSQARKAASAQIAKIPEVLSRHIAQVYYPRPEAA